MKPVPYCMLLADDAGADVVVMIRLPAFGEHAILEKARALSVPPDEQELKAVGDARHAPSGVACRVLLESDFNPPLHRHTQGTPGA